MRERLARFAANVALGSLATALLLGAASMLVLFGRVLIGR